MRSFSPPAIVFAVGGLLTSATDFSGAHLRLGSPHRSRTAAAERAADGERVAIDAREPLELGDPEDD